MKDALRSLEQLSGRVLFAGWYIEISSTESGHDTQLGNDINTSLGISRNKLTCSLVLMVGERE